MLSYNFERKNVTYGIEQNNKSLYICGIFNSFIDFFLVTQSHD